MTAIVENLIDRQARLDQQRAVRPSRSVWVPASAGAGKTTVLIDRTLALMLAGTPPGRILCLTFTKAAAAEMANRLAERLARWTAMSDDELGKDLHRITGQVPEPGSDAMRRARRLFARVLECPGGMKIQTIHAFCQSLLRRFPLEAGIAPHFEPLDERSAAEQMLAAREIVLERARAGTAPHLAAALAAVTARVSEPEFGELMRGLAAERGRLMALVATFGLDGLIGMTRRCLRVADGDSEAGLLAAGTADPALDLLGLRLCVAALSGGSAGDVGRGAGLAGWLAAPASQRMVDFADYCRLFLTDKGAPRKNLITKAAAAKAPGSDLILQQEAERLMALGERCRAAALADATAALLALAEAMLAEYRRQKQRRAALDYDDLILMARDLLRRPGVAPWVLFKLDGGLDHILIDEAQDTNPDQWAVVQALAEEFFAGAGARREVRTVFAVGDVKQSIFSFQRADPAKFQAMRDYFSVRARAAERQWDDVALTISFRSTPAVLTAIDRVFATPAAADGVSLDGRPIIHRPFRVGRAGLVELWPPVAPLPRVDPPPWAPPVRRVAGDSPSARLAKLIAVRIAAMIGVDRLPARDRTVRAGDFLVLVRRRTSFVEELIRELKQRGVPVAGVDRMVLTDQLAVMDLMALGQFLLLPDDDLTLATVLRSPLIGLGEDALFDLAHGRGDERLWRRLRARRAEPGFAAAHDRLAGLLARVDFVPPYELFAELLGKGGGRRRLLARLGPDAADPIEEFLNLALQHERTHVPSLQSFLAWLAAGKVEIKRDLDQESGGQVRVMTVHGAKGLQAPIVILPDTMNVPQVPARLLWAGPDGGVPLWSPRVDCDEAVAEAARARQKLAASQEHRRLLYVAMTRAEDRLYVAGWQGDQAPPADCWYNLIADGLAGSGEEFAFDTTTEIGARDGWQGVGRRVSSPQQAPAEDRRETPPPPAFELPPPDWLGRPPPPEPTPPRPLAPSHPGFAEPAVRTPLAADEGRRFQRGRIVHRLLELLPEVPPERRAAACRRYLAQPVHRLDPAEQAATATEILRLFEDPAFAPLFGPASRAEVPVIGCLEGSGGTLAVAGQIDRLVIEESVVRILDYKTNRPPPARPGDVAPAYLQQMASYRALLRRIYPGHRVACGLLWTDGPTLMELPDTLLDAHAPGA